MDLTRAYTLVVVLLLVGSTLPAMGAVTAQPDTTPAELAIGLPDYIEQEVSTTQTDDTEVYILHHGTAEINPQNFDSADVVGFGILTDAGQLAYDDEMDLYRFNAENNTGTFELYWEVEETRVVDAETTNNGSNASATSGTGTTTETVIRRYTATVRVDATATYQHIEEGSMAETQANAENWEEWTAALRSIYGEGVNIEQKTQWSVQVNKVRENPAAVLSGNFTAILLAMVMTLGGLLVLALFVGLHIASNWSAWSYIRETEALKADELAADEKLAEIELEEKKRRLANADWNDLEWPDSVARAYRRVGKTPFRAILELASARLPNNLVEHRLQAMAQEGYVGIVERADDDVRTDGGSDAADGGGDTDTASDAAGPIIAARVVREEDVPENTETHDLSNPSEAFVKAVDKNAQPIRDFDLVGADVDPSRIDVEQAPMEIEELMAELEVQRQDFEDPDEWGEYLLEFVEFVREHEFCDDQGSPDEIQWIINQWMDTDDVLADIFEIPHFKFESQALQFALDQRDPVEEASQLVDGVRDGRYA